MLWNILRFLTKSKEEYVSSCKQIICTCIRGCADKAGRIHVHALGFTKLPKSLPGGKSECFDLAKPQYLTLYI